MANLTFVKNSTVNVLLTKTSLSNLIELQQNTILTLEEQLTEPQMISFLTTIGDLLTNTISNNILAEGASLLFSFVSESSDTDVRNLRLELIDTWNYLRSVRSDWNGKKDKTVFKDNTITQIRLSLPVKVYHNKKTKRDVNIFVGKGYMFGAITNNGIELGS